jgi:hypothetical protein
MSIRLAYTTLLISLFLLMKAPVTDAQLTVERLGQSKGNVPSERHSLFKENGTSFISSTYFPLMLQSRYSILLALSLDRMLTVSIVEGLFNQVSFGNFIEGVLDQMSLFPATNSVIVMDNCQIHKAPWILDRIRQRYSCFLMQSLITGVFQGHALRISTTLLARLQSNQTCIFSYQGTHPTEQEAYLGYWRVRRTQG